MNTIRVYTDGSATTADKPGGWAWVITVDGIKHLEGSGYSPLATNNDMEMEAAIQGLAAAHKFIANKRQLLVFGLAEQEQIDRLTKYEVTLVSDSQLILGWASGRYRFKQIEKMSKYLELQTLVNQLHVKDEWVRGHSGDEHNERCDKLANAARLQKKAEEDKIEAIAAGKTFIGTKKIGVMCIWYGETLKIIDLESNVVENYSREVHGQRGSMLEIRPEKIR